MTAYSTVQSVFCYYFMRIPTITKEVDQDLRQICKQNKCRLEDVSTTNTKAEMVVQIPAQQSVQSLADQIMNGVQGVNKEKWQEGFALYTVGLPYKTIRRAIRNKQQMNISG